MLPDLPQTYYLDNVATLFEHVARVYSDLLDDEQLAFLDTFERLGEDAQKLHIRLLNRGPTCFRESKIEYTEIADRAAAVDELAAAGCIAIDPEIERETLLALYTKPELLAQLDASAGLARLRRAELEAELLESADDEYFNRLRQRDRVLQLLQQEPYELCQMLFFGNLNQSMTDFVLRDLGLYQFEAYLIDHDHRPYRSRLEIEQHWLLHRLEALFAGNLIEDRDLLGEMFDMIPDDIDPDAPAFRKSQHLRYEISRQLERCGELSIALDNYRKCQLPPSRERIARILAQQQQPEDAIGLCGEILEQPLDDEEIQFAAGFAACLARRHDLELPAAAAEQQVTHRPEVVELELEYNESVEIAAAEYFDAVDGRESCFYVENSLFNGVLGLLLWDVIFAPLSGAFYNPFQYRPSDFYAPDFCRRRADLLARTWAEIETNDDIRRIVGQRWQQKHGLMNPLVNWQALEPELIELALERIEHAHWRAVFDRVLADLRNNRAGFPDLVHFPPTGGYCLIEVKGPGDSLQKNQQRWMQFFSDHAIPHRLARVTWKTA